MAIFHIVQLVITNFISKMECRACFNLSKMSKNSPKSFVVRENRRLEVGKNSFFIHGMFIVIEVANSNQLALH